MRSDAFHWNLWAKGDTFFGVPPISKPTRSETVALSEEAQPTLGPWTGFEPVRLETLQAAKRA
ncbi:hypothetical protein E2C01_035523 [Portunus trituberculatus]|uniref:Uncharacterized protein n=1 Tax=Portunus trituberculatus TaxID=210409 RepID=A0A5B7FA04_PORTR|nr:hypothetical protein [Portunus trituberculatus]